MPKKPILRSCVVCREKKEKRDLLRIVRATDGSIQIDQTGKMPGRGAYMCLSEKCINHAKKTKKLDNSLETEIPEEIYMQALECINNER